MPLKTIIRQIIAILLGLCLGIAVLGGLFFALPGFRNVVLRPWMKTKMVGWYNHIRPRLNFRNNGLCLAKLANTEAQFAPIPNSIEATTGCILDNVVFVSQAYLTYNRSTLMTCALASAMYTFEKKVVQPIAQKYFKQPVAKIIHVGTYNCRPMRGSSQLLSEHAYANAIDITGFQLQDGTVINVKRHWNHEGDAGKFLHTVAKKACRKFRKVLTPNFNALHHDHFHLDQGFVKRCGY
jgi:hypothetical protein